VLPSVSQIYSCILHCPNLGVEINITKQALFSFSMSKIRDNALYGMFSLSACHILFGGSWLIDYVVNCNGHDQGQTLTFRDGHGVGSVQVELHPHPYPFSKITLIPTPIPIGYWKLTLIPIPIRLCRFTDFVRVHIENKKLIPIFFSIFKYMMHVDIK